MYNLERRQSVKWLSENCLPGSTALLRVIELLAHIRYEYSQQLKWLLKTPCHDVLSLTKTFVVKASYMSIPVLLRVCSRINQSQKQLSIKLQLFPCVYNLKWRQSVKWLSGNRLPKARAIQSDARSS